MEEAGLDVRDSAGVLDADAVTIGTIDVWTVVERAGQELTVGAQLIMVETSVEYSVETSSLAETVQAGAAPLQEVMVL